MESKDDATARKKDGRSQNKKNGRLYLFFLIKKYERRKGQIGAFNRKARRQHRPI